MADSDRQASVEQFIAVTGATAERASFFLEAAGWNLQVALGAFFEDVEGGASGPPQDTQPPPSPPPAQPSVERQTSGSGRSGFATLSDYQRDDTSTEDSEKFYAGGSEHSGQMIAGPPRKKPDIKNLASDVFEAAKKQGAEKIEDEEESERKERAQAFRGTGFRLGASEGPSVAIPGSVAPERAQTTRHILTFWSNGFSIDNGPLRDGKTEEDRTFLASVTRGEIPQELIRAARGGKVDINIEDKRNESYVAQAPKVVAFSGEGHKLGSLAPTVAVSAPSSSDASSSSSSSPPPPSVPLDPSQPTTSVQIRLADGTRLVVKFNPSHTVNDIRQFINLSRPAMSTATYVLMTTFPNRELSDPTQTLEDAQLLNAVIVQRMR